MIQKSLILGVAFVFLEVCTFGFTSTIVPSTQPATLNNETFIVINTTSSSIRDETIDDKILQQQNIITTTSILTTMTTLSNSTTQQQQEEDNFTLPDSCSAYKVVNYFAIYFHLFFFHSFSNMLLLCVERDDSFVTPHIFY